MTQLEPFYKEVQSHYDISNEFYELFLDSTMTYSCGLFTRGDMSLEEAQRAKLDHVFEQADLRPGMRVLDLGFGWGSALRRMTERFGVRAVGLTLSEAQCEWARRRLAEPIARGEIDIRLQGWEEFYEPVDRIVTIETFEHVRRERYAAFFERCRELLPPQGRLVLQTSLMFSWYSLERLGVPLEHENVLFAKFIGRHIFPGGQLCDPQEVFDAARTAGFRVLNSESLRENYPRTLEQWAERLQAHKRRAIELTSEEVYRRYLHYLTGCAKHFRSGHLDVMLFTMQAP